MTPATTTPVAKAIQQQGQAHQDLSLTKVEAILQATVDKSCLHDSYEHAVAVAYPLVPADAEQKTGQGTNDWICACGEANDEHFNFCGMCGARPNWECGSCQRSDNLRRFKFCVGCGTPKDAA